MRSPTLKRALELFLSEGFDAVAGLKQPLVAYVKANRGFHLIDGRFAAIEHAIAVPKGHSAGARYLKAFVEEMKASGRVAASLERTGDLDAAARPSRLRHFHTVALARNGSNSGPRAQNRSTA